MVRESFSKLDTEQRLKQFYKIKKYPFIGRHWKDPSLSKPAPQYTDPLRNIMQQKLPELGTLYYYLFVAPELKPAIE